MKEPIDDTARLRIDKWLWMARLYKTRSLAGQAVSGGRVHVNGERVKPARAVKIGDMLTITLARAEMEVEVTGIPVRRGPAPEAATMYAETDESRQRREADAQRRREQRASDPVPGKRPDKKARRDLARMLGRK